METLVQFFNNSIEVKNFGFNIITISSLMTVILSTYQMWGLTKQAATIKRKKSIESIYLPLFIFAFFYLTTTIMYGLYTDKLSVIYNGLNAVFFLIILLMAWRYKKINLTDILSLCIFSLLIPLMIIVSDKKIAYMGCASIMLCLGLLQLILLIRTKKRGSLEPKLFNVYLVTNSSWLIYGIITKDWVFQVSSSIGLVVMISISILLRRYKDN